MRIGFIGVGQMGGGLARNLIRAGHDVLIYDLNPEAVQKCLEAGTTGRAAQQLSDLADSEVVFTSLPLPEHVEQVMLGEDGLYDRFCQGVVHLEVSTIDPDTARKLCDAAEQRGLGYLQCPLGKTPSHAEKGEEPIFVGGKQKTFAAMQPLLESIGSQVVYMGEVEAPAAFKLLSNLIGMTNLVVLSEGMRIGEKAGIDGELLLELLADTGARSFQMDVRGPWILKNDFQNRFGLDLALKDVRLGCLMADQWGNSAKTMKTALEYFQQASTSGFGGEDCNAVHKVIK